MKFNNIQETKEKMKKCTRTVLTLFFVTLSSISTNANAGFFRHHPVSDEADTTTEIDKRLLANDFKIKIKQRGDVDYFTKTQKGNGTERKYNETKVSNALSSTK